MLKLLCLAKMTGPGWTVAARSDGEGGGGVVCEETNRAV